MCSGWIRTITKPVQMPALVRRRGATGGGITVENCAFLNCETAIHIGSGRLTMTGSLIQNCGIAIAASGNAHIDASFMRINECETVFKELG